MYLRFSIFAFVASMLWTFDSRRVATFADGPPAQAPTTVKIDDVGRSVIVLGTLGFPLRAVVTVRGRWSKISDGAKPGSTYWFHVYEVNGKPLSPPVGFRSLDVDARIPGQSRSDAVDGEEWEMRAYENWPVDDPRPREYLDELNVPPASPAPRGPSQLIGVLKKRVAAK